MKILTCNIRCSVAEDGPNNWVHRRGMCVDVIRSRAPDVICFQELWAEQFADISSALSEYQSHTMVDEPTGCNPVNGIFYRTSVFTLTSAGGYWLSEHPHVAGTSSWNSAYVRLANWARLEDQATGCEFRILNAHLDNVSQVARENQARLLCEDASAYPKDYPQILTGDMNCDSRNEAIAILTAGGWIDTYGSVHGTEDPGFTYHEFLGPQYESDTGKMDWIFARGGINVVGAEIIEDSVDGRFPSDHYFVGADVIVSPGKSD